MDIKYTVAKWLWQKGIEGVSYNDMDISNELLEIAMAVRAELDKEPPTPLTDIYWNSIKGKTNE